MKQKFFSLIFISGEVKIEKKFFDEKNVLTHNTFFHVDYLERFISSLTREHAVKQPRASG